MLSKSETRPMLNQTESLDSFHMTFCPVIGLSVIVRFRGERERETKVVVMDLMEKNMELIEVQKLEGHTDRVWNAAWNPVSPILASCSGDNTVRIWEQSSLSRSWSCKVPLVLYFV